MNQLRVETFPDDYPSIVTDDGVTVCPSVSTVVFAEHLVLCWNVHDELVTALEDCVKALGNSGDMIRACRKAHAMIVKARGKETSGE